MTPPASAGLPAQLAFPDCGDCPYVRTGTPDRCAACAAANTNPVPPDHCPICCQKLRPDATCGNWICGWKVRYRGFSRVDAIAMFSGELASVIKEYKYDPEGLGWSLIFGRLVVGWLEREQPEVDLIVGNPTAVTRRPHQHIEEILAAARVEDPSRRWPFPASRRPVLIKRADTARSAGQGWADKMDAARRHAEAIEIARPDVVDGARVLLVDDVFTTGAQFVTVSQLLLEAGARDVRGLVLARTPWG